MSPDRARVFIAEDDSTWQDMLGEMVEDAGHTVVGRATNLKDALEKTKHIEGKVDVAIIDGNLDPDESGGYDGQAVLQSIRKNAPSVKTVGMSGNSVRGTDVDLGKANSIKIGEVIKGL